MLQISNTNNIIVDGIDTKFSLKQEPSSTVIFTPENQLKGVAYQVHQMPHVRYSTTHDAPASGVAGCAQLEQDLKKLTLDLDVYAIENRVA